MTPIAKGKARPIIKYPGSKQRIAEWIVDLMPEHRSYLEPFFGSGAVFFRKSPSPIETINDLDGEIVNLFRVVRDTPEALERAIALAPYSREEYDLAWGHHKKEDVTDSVELARLTLIRYWQAVGSRQIYRAGWRRDVAGREAAYTLRNWVKLPERMAEAMERLREAQIEHADGVDLIRKFRSPGVLIYADPPYVLQKRSQKQYNVEMADTRAHIELLKALRDHPGYVILSGYESELYNDMLHDWTVLKRDTTAENGVKRVEVLWVNYEPQMTLIWEG